METPPLPPSSIHPVARSSITIAAPHFHQTEDLAHRSVPFFKLFVFADFLDVFLMTLGSIGAVANGVALPLVTFFFGQMIDAFGKSSASTPLLHEVSKVTLRFVYVGLGAGVASFLQVAFWMITGERQAARIRSLYLRGILRQDVVFFDTEASTGEIVARMSGDTILIQEAMGEKVGKFLQFLSTFIGGFVVAFVRGWKLTLVMLLAIPPLVVAGGILTLLTSKSASTGQEAYAQADAIVKQVIGAIRTVVSFTGEKKAVEKYGQGLNKAYKAAARQGLTSGLGFGSITLICYCTYGLAIWYGSKLIVNEGYSGGSVVNVIIAVLTGGMGLGQASPSLNAFAAGKAAAYKMFEVIHRVPEIDAFHMKGVLLDSVKGEIEFNNVDFSYPARPDVKILSKFSLYIAKGTTSALVGESGSGKSTVISLIERFYDPQGGTVLVDGIDIKQLHLKWFRQQIGLVSQEPVLFWASIKENIAFGKDGATQEEIESAAQLANAAKFVTDLPQGYDTLVGDHGTQLSGGQKQRIAIARAILKNPCILLLDEATSALDAESESLVQEALDRVMINRTTVIIAHHLNTIRNADQIAVVQHGAIVEIGKHTQLMQRPGGAYAQLKHLQEMHQDQKDDALKGEVDDVDITPEIEDQRLGRKSVSLKSLQKSISTSSSLHGRRRSGNARSIEADADRKANKQYFSCFKSKITEDLEIGKKKYVADVSVFRLASFNKPEAPIFFLGSLAAAINGVIFPVYAILMSSVIKTLFEPSDKLQKDANFWAGMFVVLGVICMIVTPAQFFSFSVGGSRLVRRVRMLTFENILHQEISWFDESENSSGSLSARLSADAAQVKNMVGDALSLVVQNVATMVAALVIAFSGSWQLSLVVLAIVPLLGLQGIAQVKFLQGFSADAKVMYEEASQVATDAVSSIRTVASFCGEEKVLSLYHKKCKFPLQTGVSQGILSGLSFSVSNFVMFGAYGFCFWFGARLVQEEKMTFKEVFQVVLAITMGSLSVTQSIGLVPDITKVKVAVNSVFALLDRESKIDSCDNSGITLETVIGNIEFNHISFKYPSRPGAQIFSDLCLHVSAGKTVALVGESGSGKSTILSLLERFYDPDTGLVLLDGFDVKTLELSWLRRQMGLVSQEPVLFNDTIRANIAYGKDGIVTDDQIIAAAEASNAHRFVTNLPNGYNTCVGECGIQLSGGQKQRVAIARAIIKNPKILLLDEATSALDAQSERIVQEALDEVMVHRSSIVIAHRLSTIKNADMIVVVKNGIIAEQGRHNELMSLKDGAYATLVKLHMTSP